MDRRRVSEPTKRPATPGRLRVGSLAPKRPVSLASSPREPCRLAHPNRPHLSSRLLATPLTVGGVPRSVLTLTLQWPGTPTSTSDRREYVWRASRGSTTRNPGHWHSSLWRVGPSVRLEHPQHLTPHCSGLATRAAEFDIVRSCARDCTTARYLARRAPLPKVSRRVFETTKRPAAPRTASSLVTRTHAIRLPLGVAARPCKTTTLDRPHLGSPPCAVSWSTSLGVGGLLSLRLRPQPPINQHSYLLQRPKRERLTRFARGHDRGVQVLALLAMASRAFPPAGAPARPNPSLQRTRYASR
jgi:hypothetical protein